MRCARRILGGGPVLFGLLALIIAAGDGRPVWARVPEPSPSPTPIVPFSTPIPLPISPPQIVAEAGVLPGGILSALDRLAEALDRTIFSFGVPMLRARTALTQAAERIAELQALERSGELTPAHIRSLLDAHAHLVGVADRIVARQIAAGREPTTLVLLLIRTRIAAAEVLRELKSELEIEAESEGKILGLLADTVEDLVDVEGDILTPEREAVAPPSILRLLAEQKIAKAERDLRHAVFTVEERLARGNVLIADVELKAAAESLLVTARRLYTAGNFSEALSVARQVRNISSRLSNEKIAVEPNQLFSVQGERKAAEILQDLVEDGLIGVAEQATAELRARQAVEQIRRSP